MQPSVTTLDLQARISGAVWRFSQRYWRFVLAAMLLLLHISALRGVDDGLARALLPAHLGLILLWQPFLRGQEQVSAAQTLLIGLVALAAMLWLAWWMLAFWVVVLAGIVGGKVYQQHAPWQRRTYLVVLVYLLALLAVIVLPEIAPRKEIAPEVRTVAAYGLPLLLLMVVMFPAEGETPESLQVIDLFYSVFLMLVLAVMVLGSFTFMTLGRTSYLEALTFTLFLIAGAILFVGVAWNPRAGFGGLNMFFSRYLFSIGLPVERWLGYLAELSLAETRPERFLREAVAGLVRLPWIAGAAWSAPHGQGEAGERTEFIVEHAGAELSLRLFSRHQVSPALQWHLVLLARLLEEFYVAKLREQKLQHSAYLQAVHETGARMTHDVKNLLQSLNVLCAMAEREEQRDSPDLQAFIRRQLPMIARRLTETLDKLQRPFAETPDQAPLDAWWDSKMRQYQGAGIEFSATGVRRGLYVPGALFDSVADNLLQNALAKRNGNAALRIEVVLTVNDSVELQVCDSGRAVSPEIVAALFSAPVPSASGLGIGLYQAARQSEFSGYALRLVCNRDGEVRFSLVGKPA